MKAVILERYVMHEGDLDWSRPVSGMPRSSSSTNAGWMKPF